MVDADLGSIRQALLAHFDVTTVSGVLVVRRRLPFLPARGVLRFLTPRMVAKVHVDRGRPRPSIRPDAWAWVFLILAAGAIGVEFAMDRVTYPRTYPPAFAFALGAYGVLALGVQWFDLHRGIARALSPRSRR